jgi:hypothetical protein
VNSYSFRLILFAAFVVGVSINLCKSTGSIGKCTLNSKQRQQAMLQQNSLSKKINKEWG